MSGIAVHGRTARVSSAGYEIHIKGRVSEQLLAVFEGMDATVQSVETVLRGPVRDQAALHGLLDRIQALGLELIEVRRLPESEEGVGEAAAKE
ncbi:MAG: hypothetical protein ACHQE6_00910 [Solirubrobacterales bacterium]